MILAPVVELPRELEKLFVVLEHQLPDREQLRPDRPRDCAADQTNCPPGRSSTAVLDAAAGLTRYEAEGAFSLSLVRDGRLAPQTDLASQDPAAQEERPGHAARGRRSGSTDLGGLEALKAFCLRALRPNGPGDCRPRGVLLLSPPGCGKSALCKALGNEVGRPTLRLDVGR